MKRKPDSALSNFERPDYETPTFEFFEDPAILALFRAVEEDFARWDAELLPDEPEADDYRQLTIEGWWPQ